MIPNNNAHEKHVCESRQEMTVTIAHSFKSNEYSTESPQNQDHEYSTESPQNKDHEYSTGSPQTKFMNI